METPDALISEADAYEKYSRLLVHRELRLARQAGLLSFYDLRAGIFYEIPDLVEYFKSRKVSRCPTANQRIPALDAGRDVPPMTAPAFLPSENTGSGKSVVAGTIGTGTNQPPPLDYAAARAAHRLEQKT